jgi:hypothetical protein
MAYINIDVNVDLDMFDDDDLLDELDSRGLRDSAAPEPFHSLLTQVWHKRRTGQDFTKELDQLIYSGLGKVI